MWKIGFSGSTLSWTLIPSIAISRIEYLSGGRFEVSIGGGRRMKDKPTDIIEAKKLAIAQTKKIYSELAASLLEMEADLQREIKQRSENPS